MLSLSSITLCSTLPSPNILSPHASNSNVFSRPGRLFANGIPGRLVDTHLSLIAPSNVSFLVKGGRTFGGPQLFSF